MIFLLFRLLTGWRIVRDREEGMIRSSDVVGRPTLLALETTSSSIKFTSIWLRGTSKRFLNASQFFLSGYQSIILQLAVFNNVSGRFICGPEASVQFTLHGPEE